MCLMRVCEHQANEEYSVQQGGEEGDEQKADLILCDAKLCKIISGYINAVALGHVLAHVPENVRQLVGGPQR